MADTRSTIQLLFSGNSADAQEAIRRLRESLRGLSRDENDYLRDSEGRFARRSALTRLLGNDAAKVDDQLRSMFLNAGKATAQLGGLGSAVPVLAGLAGSATTAAGALLVLPAAGLGAAAAIGTLKIATAGFGDAVSAADPQAFAEATKDMAPAAREAAAATRELVQGPLADLRREVQGRFFEGFADDVNALGRTFVPILRTELGGIATAYAGMRQEAVGALIAPAAVEDVNTVLTDTRGVLEDMRPALGNVLDGVLAIAGQGSAEFRGLGVAVTDVSERFRQWATQAAETGRITELIREGKEELRDFGEIGGNVLDILSAAWRGLGADSADLTDNLIELTQSVEDFLESAEGQEALAALGETLQVTAEVARDVFLVALREIGPVIVAAAPAVQEFAESLGGLLVQGLEIAGPLLADFARFLSENSEIIAFVTPLLAGLVLGFGALKIITTVVGWIGSLSFVLSPIGLLLTGAAAAIAIFASRNAESAAAARDNQAAIDGLKGTLNQLTGAATGATQAQIAQDLVSKKLADGTTLLRDAIGRAGISMADFTEAAVGNPAAMAAVDAQLNRVAATLPGVRQLFDENRIGLDAIGLSFEEFAGLVSRGAEGYGELNARVRELGGTFSFTKDQVADAAGELGEVGGEFARLRGQVAEAGEQVRAAAVAGQDFQTVLEAIGAGLSSLANGAEPTRLMRDNLQALAVSAQDAARASGEAALAAGGDLAGAAREAGQAMQESRDAFLSAAEAAGVGKVEAEALADQMGLIPAAVTTQVLLDAQGADAELVTLAARFAAVPNEKSITVNTLSAEATTALQTLGFLVETLPNGQITITENDDQARAGLADIVGDVGATVATFNLDANPDPANGIITTTLAFVDGSTGTLTIDANGQPATIELNGQLLRIDSSTGTLTIDGNPNPANAALIGQKLAIDRTTGTLVILANDQDVENAKNRARQPTFSTHTIRVTVTGEVLGRGNTGLAGGGIVSPRLGAAGGMIVPGYGPGRDTFGPVWLSPGEAVLVPELARRIGYRKIMRENYRFSGGRQGLAVGEFGGLMAGGGVAGRSWLTDSGAIPLRGDGSPLVLSAPSVANEVRVFIGAREITEIVNVEIDRYDRETSRRVRVGSGVTW